MNERAEAMEDMMNGCSNAIARLLAVENTMQIMGLRVEDKEVKHLQNCIRSLQTVRSCLNERWIRDHDVHLMD